jgi:glyoxylase I family protein
MLQLHHIAIICSNYERSKFFYTEILGMKIIREVYRQERQSMKLDLSLNDIYLIELFSFPEPPKRPSRPEATGLRHLAFSTDRFDEELTELKSKGVVFEETRTDEYTGKRFVFFRDPDELPIELYEA